MVVELSLPRVLGGLLGGAATNAVGEECAEEGPPVIAPEATGLEPGSSASEEPREDEDFFEP